MSIQLENCPYCNSANVFLLKGKDPGFEKSKDSFVRVKCRDCSTNGPQYDGLPEKAIRGWNSLPRNSLAKEKELGDTLDVAVQKMAEINNMMMSALRDKRLTGEECIPACLKQIKNVNQFYADRLCYIYFLLDKGEVVYVGQSSSYWPGRILSHLQEKVKMFDDIWYVEADRQSLDAMEVKYIREFRPKYNNLRYAGKKKCGDTVGRLLTDGWDADPSR